MSKKRVASTIKVNMKGYHGSDRRVGITKDHDKGPGNLLIIQGPITEIDKQGVRVKPRSSSRKDKGKVITSLLLSDESTALLFYALKDFLKGRVELN